MPGRRISVGAVSVHLPCGVDYPAGSLLVTVTDNAITGQFETEGELTPAEAATVRNIVNDVAAGLCRCAAVTEGTWATASVRSARPHDSSAEFEFTEAAEPLKQAFSKHGIAPADLIRIGEHSDGYHLRNAIDNIAVGLMEPKFARLHFYCAVEALRISVAAASMTPGTRNRSYQWEIFRSEMKVTREQLGKLEDNALRHGDYGNATPISGAEMEATLSFLGEIICRYVAWFQRTKTSPSGSDRPAIR